MVTRIVPWYVRSKYTSRLAECCFPDESANSMRRCDEPSGLTLVANESAAVSFGMVLLPPVNLSRRSVTSPPLALFTVTVIPKFAVEQDHRAHANRASNEAP